MRGEGNHTTPPAPAELRCSSETDRTYTAGDVDPWGNVSVPVEPTCTDTKTQGEALRDVAGGGFATTGAPQENVRTAPREPGAAEVADARFELRITKRQLAAWRAFAKERGQKLADTIRDAMRELAGPERAAELGLEKLDLEALVAEFRAASGKGGAR
jgi:hypothetical protein